MSGHHENLRRRADRGQHRGAESVWAAANDGPYVAEPSPRPSPTVWWAVGAAAVGLLFVGALTLRPTGPGEARVAYEGDGSSVGPAMCLLEVTDDSNRSLADWAAAAEGTAGISRVEVIEAGAGAMSIFTYGRPAIPVESGTRGLVFEARPASSAQAFNDEPGLDRVRCWVAPDWAWVPDEPPAGTRPVIAFYTPETGGEILDRWATIVEMEGVLAAEPFNQEQSYEEFTELYADAPAMVAAVSPEILPPSVRIVAEADLADQLIAHLQTSPGIYRVIEPPEPLWHTRSDYEVESPDRTDIGSTTTTAVDTSVP